MPETTNWNLLQKIPGIDLNIENYSKSRKKLLSIWEQYRKNHGIPDHMLRSIFNPEDSATKAGRLHDLLSGIERAFDLEPVFNSPILSAPTYITMSTHNNQVSSNANSLMLGSLGATTAVEHDMIANALGVDNSYHIDKLQSDSAQRYINSTGNDTFTIQDAESMNFPSDSMEIIIADYLFRTIFIQLADDLHIITRVVAEAFRILKPEGKLLIVDQVPEWALQRGITQAKHNELLARTLAQVGFDVTLFPVFKYTNRRLAYESFPKMDFSLMTEDDRSIGIEARKV
ncbi:MAG: methyltransferase domain-containing protein [Candidatus Dojkabacteria bacterium]